MWIPLHAPEISADDTDIATESLVSRRNVKFDDDDDDDNDDDESEKLEDGSIRGVESEGQYKTEDAGEVQSPSDRLRAFVRKLNKELEHQKLEDNDSKKIEIIEGTIKRVEGSIKRVEGSIKRVEGSIKRVEESIKRVEETISKDDKQGRTLHEDEKDVHDTDSIEAIEREIVQNSTKEKSKDSRSHDMMEDQKQVQDQNDEESVHVADSVETIEREITPRIAKKKDKKTGTHKTLDDQKAYQNQEDEDNVHDTDSIDTIEQEVAPKTSKKKSKDIRTSKVQGRKYNQNEKDEDIDHDSDSIETIEQEFAPKQSKKKSKNIKTPKITESRKNDQNQKYQRYVERYEKKIENFEKPVAKKRSARPFEPVAGPSRVRSPMEGYEVIRRKKTKERPELKPDEEDEDFQDNESNISYEEEKLCIIL